MSTVTWQQQLEHAVGRVSAMAKARGLHLWVNRPWPPEDPGACDGQWWIEDGSGSDVFGPATLAECERWLDS